MPSIPDYESSILTLRFDGEDFSERGVSVYDLAHTLVSMQRIVHKAYLAMNDRLELGKFPKKEERKTLALTLGKRRFGSDAFGLVPLLTDPFIQGMLVKVADYVASGMVGYFVGDVLERLKKEPNPQKQVYIESIHAEVVNIVSRIDATGGVDSIQIGAPLSSHPLIGDFTPKTKDYLKTLESHYTLGTYQVIKGNVYRFYPNSQWLSIRRMGGKKVDIVLKEPDFTKIRYHTGRNPLVSFAGWPRYRFGVESRAITEFEADSIQIIEQA